MFLKQKLAIQFVRAKAATQTQAQTHAHATFNRCVDRLLARAREIAYEQIGLPCFHSNVSI